MADDRSVSCGAAGRPTRRVLLAASAAALPVLLAACKGTEVLGTPPGPPADVEMLRNAIDHETALIASYTAALATGGTAGSQASAGSQGSASTSAPAGSQASAGSQGSASTSAPAGDRIAAALTSVLSDHTQHLTELRSRLFEPAALRSPSATHGPAAAGRGSAVVLSMAELEQAERAASDRLIAQLAGLPPTLAQLFASIAASESTHVPYLRAARRGR